MTKQDFLAGILEYYGNFANEGIYKQFLKTLSKIADKDLDRLHEWFLENVPANYRVDVKTLTDGVRACFISFVESYKNCPICGAKLATTATHCIYCDYDYHQTPEAYRATLASDEDIANLQRNLYKMIQEKRKALVIKQPCSSCGGTGYRESPFTEIRTVCPICKGSGKSGETAGT